MPAADRPFDALLAAPRGEPLALLHSCGAGPAWLFTTPVDVLTVEAADVHDALDALRAFTRKHQARCCVGYIGYDARDAVEPIPRGIPDDFEIPVLHFAAYADWQEWPDNVVPPAPETERCSVEPHVTRSDYERLVAAVVEHIRCGDIFQANLTQPFSGEFDGDPRALFWRLCEVSPAPFASYLDTGDGLQVLSSSPEEFLWRQGDAVRTRPIKGTRPRGTDALSDASLMRELRGSQKDNAELAMIVDLLRNDLGKVAATGSVEVGPFPEFASFPQVHHLFATVTAKLHDSDAVDAAELIRATFPGGSITGAPKLRAMEILEELELVRRGVYTGAIGWIGPGPDLHLNIAIRTMVMRAGRVRFHVGGGITADSDPAAEFDETIDKAEGMLRALGERRRFRGDGS